MAIFHIEVVCSDDERDAVRATFKEHLPPEAEWIDAESNPHLIVSAYTLNAAYAEAAELTEIACRYAGIPAPNMLR